MDLLTTIAASTRCAFSGCPSEISPPLSLLNINLHENLLVLETLFNKVESVHFDKIVICKYR